MGFLRVTSTVVWALPLLLAACQTDYDFTPAPEPDEIVYADPPPDFGSWLSMDKTPEGKRLAIAYYDREFGGLGFATGVINGDEVTWLHEQVDGYQDPNSGLDVGDRGQYASMKVAPDGTVWIAYYDAGKKSLYYAHRLGGAFNWVTGLIDAGNGSIPRAGQWASLDLDADGKPVVAYYDESDKILKVARLAAQDESVDGYEWLITEAQRGQPWSGTDAEGLPITREADVGKFARLLIDGSQEYIAYYDAGQQRLGLLEGSGGSFTQSFVSEAGVDMGQWPSMIVSGGTLKIAFHDVANQDLLVATRGSGGFTIEIADGGEFVGADTEILERNGELAVLYFDGQNNDMKYATKSGAAWVTTSPGSPELAVGFHNEIVEADGRWWVGSYNFTDRTLFLAPLQ
jgi:hypothetical protein